MLPVHIRITLSGEGIVDAFVPRCAQKVELRSAMLPNPISHSIHYFERTALLQGVQAQYHSVVWFISNLALATFIWFSSSIANVAAAGTLSSFATFFFNHSTASARR
jgi:hypothetical protein